jgi:hypothetical protein
LHTHLHVDLVLERAPFTGDPSPISFRINPYFHAVSGGTCSFALEVEIFGVVGQPDIRT